MSFLAPAGLAFLGLLPVVLALYFLKLKRRDRPVSSTYLWRRAVEDLRANTPFQRLRGNLLLWLQLALLALLVAALARPALRARPGAGRHYICLVDTSASMGATDVSPSRLDRARREALRLVDQLGRDDRMMLMTFDARPRVVVPFTASRARLRRALRGLRPRHAPTDFAKAVEDLAALARGRSDVHVFLLTDGAFERPERPALPAVEVSFVRVGVRAENLAITALDARLSPENWDQPQVFARVENFGSAAVRPRLDLYLDGRLVDARDLEVPAGGGRGVVFSDPALTEGLVRAALSTRDDLAVDDEAWLVLAAPRKVRVLVVTPGNYFLELALRSDPVCEPTFVPPGGFGKRDAAGSPAPADYDLVVFDRCSPAPGSGPLPPGAYLFFDALPPLEGFRARGTASRPVVIDWDRTHPLNEHVNYAGLFLARAMKFAGPAGARVLVEGSAGPLVVGFNSPAHRMVVVGFDTFASRWPLRPAFPVFLANAVRYLAGLHAGGQPAQAPGRPLVLPAPRGAKSVRVDRPGGASIDLPVRDGAVRLDETFTCGPYTFHLSPDRSVTRVVNLLDRRESDTTPGGEIDWRGTPVAPAERAFKENREIWPWLAAAALVLLVAEWYVYNRRVYL